MTVDEILKELRRELAIAKAEGVSHVEIERYEALVLDLERWSTKSPADIGRELIAAEMFRESTTNRLNLRDLKRRRAESMVGHTVTVGAHALKVGMAINGGAAVALLALFGALSKDGARVPAGLADALGLFTLGVLFAAIASGSAYISQAGFGQEFGTWSARCGRFGRRAAVTFTALALGAFVTGGWLAYRAIDTAASFEKRADAISHELPMARPPFVEDQTIKPKE